MRRLSDTRGDDSGTGRRITSDLQRYPPRLQPNSSKVLASDAWWRFGIGASTVVCGAMSERSAKLFHEPVWCYFGRLFRVEPLAKALLDVFSRAFHGSGQISRVGLGRVT